MSQISAKTKRKVKSKVGSRYNAVRDQVDDFIHAIENKVSKNTGKAKDTLGSLKEQITSIDLSEHKELGIGLLIGSVLGVVVGAGGTYLLKEHCSEEEEEAGSRRVEDFLHLALEGLRLWNKFRE